MVWFGDDAVATNGKGHSIDELILRRAGQYMDRWPSACGYPSRYVTNYSGQLSLDIPPWMGTGSARESWGAIRHSQYQQG